MSLTNPPPQRRGRGRPRGSRDRAPRAPRGVPPERQNLRRFAPGEVANELNRLRARTAARTGARGHPAPPQPNPEVIDLTGDDPPPPQPTRGTKRKGSDPRATLIDLTQQGPEVIDLTGDDPPPASLRTRSRKQSTPNRRVRGVGREFVKMVRGVGTLEGRPRASRYRRRAQQHDTAPEPDPGYINPPEPPQMPMTDTDPPFQDAGQDVFPVNEREIFNQQFRQRMASIDRSIASLNRGNQIFDETRARIQSMQQPNKKSKFNPLNLFRR